MDLVIVIIGLVPLLVVLASPRRREAIFTGARLPPAPFGGFELALLAAIFLLIAGIAPAIVLAATKPLIARAADPIGMRFAVLTFGLHGPLLLTWPIFRIMRERLHQDYGVEPPAEDFAPPARPTSWLRAFTRGFVALVLSLPIVMLVSAGWTWVLRSVGLPADPQDAITTLRDTHSIGALGLMTAVACVLAPINEELFFRASLYRCLRRRLGLAGACVLSSLLFGVFHFNLASLVPLSVFGAALVLAYENTGDIRVPVIAHAIFNLISVVLIFVEKT